MTCSKPSRPDPFFQALARSRYVTGKGMCPNQGHIALHYKRLNAFGTQAVIRRSPSYRHDKIAPRFLGIGFELVAIHAVLAFV